MGGSSGQRQGALLSKICICGESKISHCSVRALGVVMLFLIGSVCVMGYFYLWMTHIFSKPHVTHKRLPFQNIWINICHSVFRITKHQCQVILQESTDFNNVRKKILQVDLPKKCVKFNKISLFYSIEEKIWTFSHLSPKLYKKLTKAPTPELFFYFYFFRNFILIKIFNLFFFIRVNRWQHNLCFEPHLI